MGENQVPSMTGSTVYLSAGDDLNMVLGRVEAAGGRVLMPKTNMGEMIGNLAFFADSEGNRIGLHSRD
jgi:predicted enzyme related to lactoylglutathione lyase